MQQDFSVLRPVSIGTLAENKGLRSKKILVTPTEVLNYIDGELASNQMTLDFSGTDEAGTVKEGSIDTDNVVEATWLPYGSNRITAPDVRRGERVLLWQVADQDKYYWTPLGLDDAYRALETVIFAINASPHDPVVGEGEEPPELNIENCYFFEMSSHQKHMVLQTSTANGELAAYQIEISGGKGTLKMMDDKNNYGLLDSVNTLWHFQNAYGTRISLDKESIEGFAPKFVNFEAGVRATIKGGGSQAIFSQGNITLQSATISLKKG